MAPAENSRYRKQTQTDQSLTRRLRGGVGRRKLLRENGQFGKSRGTGRQPQVFFHAESVNGRKGDVITEAKKMWAS